MTADRPLQCLRLSVAGHVQGVGYRPFVYRLAHELSLQGWVRNALGRVEITVQGGPPELEQFVRRLVSSAPPLARPVIDARQAQPPGHFEGFGILASEAAADADIFIPPDYFCCDECLVEIRTPGNRRHRYPFTNCTQCGPRYTLITALPYDRPNTAMAAFPLCADCLVEYQDPLDRRFHAEPVACPACGPQVELLAHGQRLAAGDRALEGTVEALKDGKIVAVKGVGGYHLMCDARRPDAVRNLRQRKHRPHKPLAVMFPQGEDDPLSALRGQVRLDEPAEALIRGPARPIVLVPRNSGYDLAEEVAPGLNDLGVFLPYSPLHHLLLSAFGGPLVATSGNLSGEPVLTSRRQALSRLGGVADLFLNHDRPIVRPADDPVWRIMDGSARPLRHGRGSAPLELTLPGRLDRPTLAVGGHMKNTLALAWNDRLVVSPHIGDMSSARSLDVFEQVAADMQALYGVRAEQVVADAHPGYTTHRWAHSLGLPMHRVFHHHAHASALCLDAGWSGPSLVFTWDGVGYGEDGTLWGGETLLGSPGHWRRIASMRPFRLPGGDLAARAPWRSAAALCWETDLAWAGYPIDDLVRQAWQRGINAPASSAVGRLFDAAAALVLGRYEASFEGQGPMELEAVAADLEHWVEMPLEEDAGGLARADWRGLLQQLLASTAPVAERSALFHESLAQCLLQQARWARERWDFEAVGLTGGVFQNARLSCRARRLLEDCGFQVLQSRQIPCNDAGISAGQIMQILHRR